MAIIALPQMFAVIVLSDDDKISTAIAAKYPGDFLALGSNDYFLVAAGTAKEVCDNLGVSDGSMGSVIVVAFTSYFGRANPQIWEWVASRLGAKRG